MGLRKHDLRDLVYNIFEIDSFSSKMGEDKDIVTLSFSVKTLESAKDLESFIEKGYLAVLDADSTAGEQSDGTYKVFVELERDKETNNNIMDIIGGIENLTDINNFKFRYYKNFRSVDLSKEALDSIVPLDPDNYGIKVNESSLDNYKNFFNRSFLDSVDMIDNDLLISKKYADPLMFEFVDFVDSEDVKSVLSETFNINAFPEIMFLTKYIGDYNISKYGDKIVFENNGKTLITKRI